MMLSLFRGDPPQFSGSDVTERPFALAIGGGVDVRAFHVATDLVRLRHHENYSAWTWRIAAGVMLPGK
jgi:hypothetical protein